MRPQEVNPNAWSDHEVIFDDGEFSAVSGLFDSTPNIGVRWNGGSDEERGYPGQGAYPLWFVVPDFLILPTLERLHTTALREELVNANGVPYAERIQEAIRRFAQESN